jgi:hypothetical protein
MDRVAKLLGGLLWSLVFIVAAFSYTGGKHSGNGNLKILCEKYKSDPYSIPISNLDQVLSDLNELRSIHADSNSAKSPHDLQWIDSCAGLVLVEMKSRQFEKNFKKQQK